jgi:hypothetical protein
MVISLPSTHSHWLQDVDAIDSEDASVIRCLQDYIGEIHGDKCKQQVCALILRACSSLCCNGEAQSCCQLDAIAAGSSRQATGVLLCTVVFMPLYATVFTHSSLF